MTHSLLPDTSDPAPRPEPALEPGPGQARGRRRLRLAVGVVAALTALLAAATVPVDYVIESPGPTWNVLGSVNADGEETGVSDDGAVPVITVSGAPTYEADGALRMTTVAVRGCPGYPVTLLDLVGAWLDEDVVVVDRERVCPRQMTAEEVETVNQEQMVASQSTAVGAALIEAGLADDVLLEVGSVAEEQTAPGLAAGDVLRAITVDGVRTEVTDYPTLRDLMTGVAPGTDLVLTVERDGQDVDVALTTLAPEAVGADPATEGSLLGLGLRVRVDSAVDADFGLEEVGGPSAGSMFALGIVDALTPGSLTGGQDVAGTGTIAMDGSIGPIGGVRQKMAGAAQAGSAWFLAPAANCAEVVGHEPEGMVVVSVSTLHEAVEAVEAIAAGDTGSLPSCEAPVR